MAITDQLALIIKALDKLNKSKTTTYGLPIEDRVYVISNQLKELADSGFGDLPIHICSQGEYDASTGIPTIENPEENVFYLVPSIDSLSNDLFIEYIYVNGNWETFGGSGAIVSIGANNVTYNSNSNYTIGSIGHEVSNLNNDIILNNSNLGNTEINLNYSINELLKTEKVRCIHHDNFHRDNNSNDIGYNGTEEVKMDYTNVDTVAGRQLAIGIYNNKAAFTNPSSVSAGSVAMRCVDPGIFPYKITVSSDELASVAVGVIDSTKYVRIVIKPNIINIIPANTSQVESITYTHALNKANASIYVYKNRLKVMVANQTVIDIPANFESTLCGLLFRAGDTNTSFNMFNVFLPDTYVSNNVDSVIEYSDTTDQRVLGIIQTGNANGVIRDDNIKAFGNNSLRFYLTPNDEISALSIRSELVPVDPKIDNKSNLQTKIIDYDVYFPSDYDQESDSEIVMQMHDTPDGVNVDGLPPGISLTTKDDLLYLYVRNHEGKAQESDKPIPADTYELMSIPKGKWTHVTVFFKEGYMTDHYPMTMVWIDGQLKVVSYEPNAYNELYGGRFKIGLYKSTWKTSPTTVDHRTMYIDNLKIWQ